jgi:hypothetical protein
VVAIATIYGFYQIIAEKNLLIEEKTRSRILEEKLKYWNGSDDPALKSGLLKLWNKRGDVPEEIWNSFNPNEDTEVLIAMASHPWVPYDIEIRLLKSENVRIRISAILNNKRNRKEVFQLLATDSIFRRLVAKNSNTPVELLKKLATDEDSVVRRDVAGNSNTPGELLKKLATDKDLGVSIEVALSSNTSVELLKKLATDKESYVRLAVAKNSNTPTELLKKLEADKDSDVHRAVAGNSNTPLELMKKLVTDKDSDVRREVAKNSNTPVELLKKLATDKDSDVRKAVARNPSTPLKILKRLAVDKIDEVMYRTIFSIINLPENEWK